MGKRCALIREMASTVIRSTASPKIVREICGLVLMVAGWRCYVPAFLQSWIHLTIGMAGPCRASLLGGPAVCGPEPPAGAFTITIMGNGPITFKLLRVLTVQLPT